MKNPWFKSKSYGYGWTPVTWQGWLVLVIFIALLTGISLRVDYDNTSLNYVLANFIIPVFLLVVILLAICWKTGEKAHWRWGGQMLLVYTTFPDHKTAKEISKKLVEEKLIACANLSSIESQYIWDGEIMESQEITAFLKTTNWNFRELKSRLTELHPYERVCIIKIKGSANQEYFQWLTESVKN